jgi:GT2 family glycosyltransferase
MMKKIAVVILNWNGKNFLDDLLPTLVQHTPPEVDIVVGDNASSDNSVEFLKQNYPQIQIIQNDKNYGFAEGYNRVLNKVKADYFVLLNSDVEVTPNWIEPVIDMMEADDDIAICQPKLLSFYNRDTFEYAGGAGGYIDKYGYPFCRGRLFTTLEKDNGQYDDACEIFWATGAAMFVKAKIWKQLGGLDGDFFAHMEEIDFCWRAKNGGYKVYYCPQSVVYHIGGGTLPPSSPFKTFLNFRNNFSLLFKNLQKRQLTYVFPIRILMDWVAALKFLSEKKPKEFTAVMKAHWDFYRQIPTLKHKRKKINQRKVSNIYNGNIVLEYYLKDKKIFSKLGM